MKKLICVFIVVLMLIPGLNVNAASLSSSKTLDIEITSSSEHVQVGESVKLIAKAIKHGSQFSNYWDGAVGQDTVLNQDTGEYVSMASFKADKPGKYVIKYKIEMQSGNSDTNFLGEAVKEIIVESSVEVAGADIRNLIITPVKRSDGRIMGYSVIGNTYIKWNDDSSTLYGSVYFYMTANEYTKNVDVVLEVDGKQYVYPVEVNL